MAVNGVMEPSLMLTVRYRNAMSALPPKADMCSAQSHVRFGPKADMSYVRLVGIGRERRDINQERCPLWAKRAAPASLRLQIERDRLHRPHIARGHHVGGCRGVFLEMLGRPVFLGCRIVVIDLKEKHMVRVGGRYHDVILAAARFLDRSRAILLDRREILVQFCRRDVEIDRVDDWSIGLR